MIAFVDYANFVKAHRAAKAEDAVFVEESSTVFRATLSVGEIEAVFEGATKPESFDDDFKETQQIRVIVFQF